MRLFLLLVACMLLCATSQSQTKCEQILNWTAYVEKKCGERVPEKELVSDADMDYMIKICRNADVELDKIASGSTDKYLLNEYRFSKLEMHSKIAFKLLMAEKPAQNIYGLLEPVINLLFICDSVLLKDFEYVTCSKADGSSDVVTSTEYDKFGTPVYYTYLSACYQLKKKQEADIALRHYLKYNYEMMANEEYATVSLMVHWKAEMKDVDDLFYTSCNYLFNCYANHYGYDTTFMPMPLLMNVLLDPANIQPGGASFFDNFYGKIKYYHESHAADSFFTEDVQSNMIKQAINCYAAFGDFPSILFYMRYKQSKYMDEIIALNDTALMQKLITQAEQYIATEKKLKAPYFWLNLATLYTKTGNISAAAEAEKKYEKYK